MSKPLTTKVNTPLSENVHIGPKVSIFCVALSFFSKAVVVIMLEYCPAAKSPKGGDPALLQYVTVHIGIHGSLYEL